MTTSPRAANQITIRSPRPAELQAIRQLRYEVLDAEKGLPLRTASATDDAPSSIHVAAFMGDQPVSTVRLESIAPGSQTYRVRRMATTANLRGQGIGAQVLAAAEAEAKRRGVTGIELHARERAVAFYARAGYVDQGGRPVHDGDTTIEMFKQV